MELFCSCSSGLLTPVASLTWISVIVVVSPPLPARPSVCRPLKNPFPAFFVRKMNFLSLFQDQEGDAAACYQTPKKEGEKKVGWGGKKCWERWNYLWAKNQLVQWEGREGLRKWERGWESEMREWKSLRFFGMRGKDHHVLKVFPSHHFLNWNKEKREINQCFGLSSNVDVDTKSRSSVLTSKSKQKFILLCSFIHSCRTEETI